MFESFMRLLCSFKIRKSGYESKEGTVEELQKYCDEVNSKMQFFDQHTKLTPDVIESDSDGKHFYKLIMNSLLGKWGQNSSSKSQTHFVTNQLELEDVLFSKDREISNAYLVSPEIIKVSSKLKKARLAPNRNSNCIINAYVCR